MQAEQQPRNLGEIVTDAKNNSAGRIIDSQATDVILSDRLKTVVERGGAILVDRSGNIITISGNSKIK